MRALLVTVAAVTLLAAGAAWFLLHDLNQAQWTSSIPAAETGSWGT
jgi:hypothetical protein